MLLLGKDGEICRAGLWCPARAVKLRPWRTGQSLSSLLPILPDDVILVNAGEAPFLDEIFNLDCNIDPALPCSLQVMHARARASTLTPRRARNHANTQTPNRLTTGHTIATSLCARPDPRRSKFHHSPGR